MDKQTFLSAKIKPLAVEVPEWGMTAHIHMISAADRLKFIKSMPSGEDEITVGEKILVNIVKFLQLVLCDENGVRLFDDSQEDYDALDAKETEVLDRLFDAAWEYTGLGVAGTKSAVKNSETSLE